MLKACTLIDFVCHIILIYLHSSGCILVVHFHSVVASVFAAVSAEHTPLWFDTRGPHRVSSE